MGREDKLEEALNQCLNRRAELLEVPSSDTEGILRLVHERIKEITMYAGISVRK